MRHTQKAEDWRCNSTEPQMSDTAIEADTLNVPKNGRFKFSFSRSSTKSKHVSSSPSPSSSSSSTSSQHLSMRKSTDTSLRLDATNGQQETQLANLQQNSHLTQNRYIILPSDKTCERNSHQSSPSSSVPLIDLLTNDDPPFHVPEETHILLPSPFFASPNTSSRNSFVSCPPPRPITRHPGSTGDSCPKGTAAAADASRCTNSNSGLSGTSKNSINSEDCLSKNSSGLPQREGENRNNNNNNNANGNGLVNKPPKGWLHPEQLITSTGVNYSVKVSQIDGKHLVKRMSITSSLSRSLNCHRR